VWLGCEGSLDARFQKSLQSLFDLLRKKHVSFGVLASERCTGDVAKRTGNEYLFQELASSNLETPRKAKPKTIVTSCPHCVKTIGDDYEKFGHTVRIVHTPIYVEQLTRVDAEASGPSAGDAVTYRDRCYLRRYAGAVEEPRRLLRRLGASVRARAEPRQPLLLRAA
jgi:Fe-S oxidoreductase